jgi:hypothetical protein
MLGGREDEGKIFDFFWSSAGMMLGMLAHAVPCGFHCLKHDHLVFFDHAAVQCT